MSLEPILESTECWCRSNVGRQTVPHRRTSDGECPVAKTKSGARDDDYDYDAFQRNDDLTANRTYIGP